MVQIIKVLVHVYFLYSCHLCFFRENLKGMTKEFWVTVILSSQTICQMK